MAVDRGDQDVLRAPHDQRPGGYTLQALAEATVGDGEEDLARHAQPPRVHDQELF